MTSEEDEITTDVDGPPPATCADSPCRASGHGARALELGALKNSEKKVDKFSEVSDAGGGFHSEATSWDAGRAVARKAADSARPLLVLGDAMRGLLEKGGTNLGRFATTMREYTFGPSTGDVARGRDLLPMPQIDLSA